MLKNVTTMTVYIVIFSYAYMFKHLKYNNGRKINTFGANPKIIILSL